ncbi:hypothetical protein GCM10010442_25460 [Kitasatospora kifunensis]
MPSGLAITWLASVVSEATSTGLPVDFAFLLAAPASGAIGAGAGVLVAPAGVVPCDCFAEAADGAEAGPAAGAAAATGTVTVNAAMAATRLRLVRLDIAARLGRLICGLILGGTVGRHRP